MKSISRKKLFVLGALAVVLGVGLYFGMHSVLQGHDATVIKALDETVARQKTKLISVADLTRQNTANDEVSKIITDCPTPERNHFDTLLDTLSKSISASELVELNSLFYQCADFYAQRKAVMTVLLTREVLAYAEIKKLRNEVQPYGTDVTVELNTWKKIADSEVKWSDYFSQLVIEQGDIIALFRNGKTAASPEVLKILAEVKNERAQLDVLSAEISEYRKSLSNL